MSSPRTVAAVDLGSNSFHLIVARLQGEQLEVVDRLRERVALAAGLDEQRRIEPEAHERALACLRRFGQRLAELPSASVRAVGTATLRKAHNAREFLAAASAAVGHPIEIVAGHEEARIVYLGVATSLAFDDHRRLVVDIGGASTELIIGEGLQPIERDSFEMGCVRFGRYFDATRIRRKDMELARTAGRIQLRGMERHYRDLGWEQAVGSSGTVKAVSAILRGKGWTDGVITGDGLRALEDALLVAGQVDKLDLPGLDADRRTAIAPGVAVLRAVFDGLRLKTMTASPGALREGLLFDLVGRIANRDQRELTIAAFEDRYRVDRDQARRVERTALALFDAVDWGVDRGLRRPLRWSARLHELGLSVAHSGYHRHGAYLLQNSAMPGFSEDDQAILAGLVLAHRRRITLDRLAEIVPAGKALDVLRLALCLRIACRLHRTRSRREIPVPVVRLDGPKVSLGFPDGWLDDHPLTRADLEDEQQVLKAAGVFLSVE